MKIGFIGLGIMGESMCANIVKKHNDTVYCSDHKQAKIDELSALGAVGCKTNTEVAKNADVIISMVPTSDDVRNLYDELMPFIDDSKICIDMGTIDPSVSVEVANKVKAKGAQFADCPVVKSKPAAIDGTLGILVGCDEELFPVIKPVLEYMGSTIIYMGGNGKGLAMKICQNTLLGQIQNGVNETLLLAKKMGISTENYAAAVECGGAKNFYVELQHKKLENEDWTTAFSLENMNKDLGICLRLSEEIGFKMPGVEYVKTIYNKGMENGLGKEDFRATYKIVRGDYD